MQYLINFKYFNWDLGAAMLSLPLDSLANWARDVSHPKPPAHASVRHGGAGEAGTAHCVRGAGSMEELLSRHARGASNEICISACAPLRWHRQKCNLTQS